MESLPEEVKNLLYSPEMLTTIRKVGEKNQLHIDQIGILQAETSSVMLGFTETHDFPNMIAKALTMDISKASIIAKDIDEMLFSKIRNSMKKTDEHTIIAPKISAPAAVSVASTEGKSVVMPSAAKAPAPAAPAVPTPPPATPPAPAMQHVEAMLSAPTVSMAPKPAAPSTPEPDVKKSDTPAPPPIYKTDPYHEPIE